MVEIAAIEAEASIWEEIELCESYMVCSMYEDAASLASSILERLRHCGLNEREDGEFYDMLESAGMVLVQSLKELGRTSDILKQLQAFFISIAAIPIEVFLTGICLQISEGSPGVKEILEEFLSSWDYVDAGYYTPVDKEENSNHKHFVLALEKYVEVAEELLRRLNSLCSVKATKSQLSYSEHVLDGHGAPLKEEILPKGFPKSIDVKSLPIGESDKMKALLKLYGKTDTGIWWFRAINLKIGNIRMGISNGKILLGCLLLLTVLVLRRKGSKLKRFNNKQAVSLKNALVDFWKLAFSYQVNPLAAVQPLTGPGTATSAGR